MGFSSDKIMSVIGHNPVLQYLTQQLKSKKLPHGLFLIGPKGIGKSRLAYQLIYSLFKEGELDAGIKPEDPLFRRLINGSHADFKHVQLGFSPEGKAQQEIPLGLIRDVVQFLQATPLEGGWRIVLIEDADCLGRKASNALLKSLEEPPEKTLLILCASQEQQVLPTLRSRCQRMALKKLRDDEVREVLTNQLNLTDDELRLLILFSEGSPGRAMMLFHLGGKFFYHEFLEVLQTAIKGQYGLFVSFIEKYTQVDIEKGFDPYRAVGYFISWWLGRYLLADYQEKRTFLIHEDKSHQEYIFKRFPVQFWEQHYHKINFFYHHPHAVGLERKYCLAVMMLGIVFGSKAYNEVVENEFC